MTKEDALVRLYVAYGGKKEDVDKLDRTADIVNKMAEYVEEHGGGGGGGSITVDSELSTTSTNPLQNKVTTEELLKRPDNTQIEALVDNKVTESVAEAIPDVVQDNTATEQDVDDVIGGLDPLP